MEIARRSRTHGPGTLNIHSRSHKRLALQFLAGAGNNLDLKILTATWCRETEGTSAPITTRAEVLTILADNISHLRKVGRTTTVTWKINRALLDCGLPPVGSQTLRLPFRPQIPVVR